MKEILDRWLAQDATPERLKPPGLPGPDVVGLGEDKLESKVTQGFCGCVFTHMSTSGERAGGLAPEPRGLRSAGKLCRELSDFRSFGRTAKVPGPCVDLRLISLRLCVAA
jgi:hypothetical protein